MQHHVEKMHKKAAQTIMLSDKVLNVGEDAVLLSSLI